MISEGQIILFRFLQADQTTGKLRLKMSFLRKQQPRSFVFLDSRLHGNDVRELISMFPHNLWSTAYP
jgi:hypothetical protein